tara:strand:- start:1325 stop:1990 length:666 start_codon:yes stop_codon:yes gene_type:complete
MDPVTMAILVGAGGAAIEGAGTLIGGAKLAKENKKRLEDLKKKEEMGALGLTAQEESAIAGRLRGAQKTAQEQSESLQKRLLAGGGMATGGQAMASEAAAQQTRMAIESDVAQKVLEADLTRQQQQEDEMRSLEAAVAERRAESIGAVTGIAGSALEAGLTTSAQQATIQGQKDISPEQVAGVATTFGIDEAKARGMIEMGYKNPELAKFMFLTASGKGAQ